MKAFEQFAISLGMVALLGVALTSSIALAGGSTGPGPTPGELVIGYGAGGDGFFEARAGTTPFGSEFFARTAYTAYNGAAPGSTRPILCNLDNDPEAELVLGYGNSGANGVAGGFVEIRGDKTTNYAHVRFLRVAIVGSTYNADNGETRPACGDVDGDGRDEIVVALGTGSGGFLKVFDDAVANFAPLTGTPITDGFIRFPLAGSYNGTNGATNVAVGNLDGDAAEEIAIGGGTGSGGLIALIDDAGAGFAALSGAPITGGFTRYGLAGTYNGTDGTTFPAICDLDGVGNGELVVGGSIGSGSLAQSQNASAGFAASTGTPVTFGFTRLGLAGTYAATNGTTRPFCGDLDGDDIEELGLGTGDSATLIDGGLGLVFLKGDLANDGLAGSDFVRATSAAFKATNNGAVGSIIKVDPPSN